MNAPTSATAVAAIQAKIDRANQMYLGTQGGTPGQLVGGIQQLELRIAAEESSIDPNRARIAHDKVQLAQMRGAERTLRQEIIEDTKKLYGIRPDGISRPLTGFRFKGMRATWKPQFAEWSAEHVATRGAEQIVLKTNSRYVAATWENGDIVITRAAFLSPAYLAAVIYHETIHFNQFTDPFRNPGTLSRRDRELKAHWAMSSVKFGLTKNEQALIDDASQRAQNAPEADAASEFTEPSVGSDLQANLDAIRRSADEIARDVGRETKRRYLGYVQDIAKESCPTPLDQRVYDKVEIFPDRTIYWDRYNEMVKEGYDNSDCPTRTYVAFLLDLGTNRTKLYAPSPSPTAAPPPPEPPTAPRVPDPPDLWAPKPRVPAEGEAALSDLVEKACANPGGFRSTADFSWFPAPGYRFSFGPRKPEDFCQRSLWDYLMTLNAQGGKLDMQDLSQRAWGYQPRSPAYPPSAPDCPRRVGDKCVPDLGN